MDFWSIAYTQYIYREGYCLSRQYLKNGLDQTRVTI